MSTNKLYEDEDETRRLLVEPQQQGKSISMNGEREDFDVTVNDVGETEQTTFKGKMQKFLGEALAALKKKESLVILLYTVLYVVSGVVNSIFLKKTMNALANYPLFLNQFTNFAYIPIFGVVVFYQMYFTKNIPKEMRVFPWWKFAIMGALDAVNGYLVVIGGIKTTGPLQQLLNQVIIPFTMVGSWFFLKERYTLVQIGGALVIVAGVVVSLLPALLDPKANAGNVFFWNIFYLTQAVPGAASNIYKDIAFKEVEMDVWYLQFWDIVYQSIIGTMLFPINSVLPPPATVPFSTIPAAMRDGALCLAGHDIITTRCSPFAVDNIRQCDACGPSPWTLPVYMAINVVYNVFILLVIKYGSATILSIASTIRLPLTNIAFSIGLIMGADVTPFNALSAAGLVVIVIGLVTYRVGGFLLKKKAAPEGEAAEGEGEMQEERTRVIFSQYMVEVQPIHASTASKLGPKSNQQLRDRYMQRLGILHPRYKQV